MNWIAVHEEVLGGKLRGFRKALKCSEAEALGILTLIWLWARKNAEITGLLLNAEKEDVARAIAPSISSSLDAMKVTDALIATGWIDEKDGELYIHDWREWQQYWYNHLEKKERDRNRKRIEREKARNEAKEAQAPPTLPEEKNAVQKKPATKKKKKTAPQKTKYAENVSMKQSEYETLVEKYGESFTQKLIEELDNYKGASGRSYESDYRAILMWVVEKCEKKYPKLIKKAEKPVQQGNPFEQFK